MGKKNRLRSIKRRLQKLKNIYPPDKILLEKPNIFSEDGDCYCLKEFNKYNTYFHNATPKRKLFKYLDLDYITDSTLKIFQRFQYFNIRLYYFFIY